MAAIAPPDVAAPRADVRQLPGIPEGANCDRFETYKHVKDLVQAHPFDTAQISLALCEPPSCSSFSPLVLASHGHGQQMICSGGFLLLYGKQGAVLINEATGALEGESKEVINAAIAIPQPSSGLPHFYLTTATSALVVLRPKSEDGASAPSAAESRAEWHPFPAPEESLVWLHAGKSDGRAVQLIAHCVRNRQVELAVVQLECPGGRVETLSRFVGGSNAEKVWMFDEMEGGVALLARSPFLAASPDWSTQAIPAEEDRSEKVISVFTKCASAHYNAPVLAPIGDDLLLRTKKYHALRCTVSFGPAADEKPLMVLDACPNGLWPGMAMMLDDRPFVRSIVGNDRFLAWGTEAQVEAFLRPAEGEDVAACGHVQVRSAVRGVQFIRGERMLCLSKESAHWIDVGTETLQQPVRSTQVPQQLVSGGQIDQAALERLLDTMDY